MMTIEFHSGNVGTNPATSGSVNNPSLTWDEQIGSAAHNPEPGLAQKVVSYLMDEFIGGIVAIRTRDLMASLLDVDSIEQLIGKKENCDVCVLIEKSLKQNTPAATRKHIVLQSGVGEGLRAVTDPAALLRVLDHLIYNAVKYSPPNSIVQVHALAEKGNIVINIRDEGVGINETARQKLFQKIARLMVDPAEVKATQGLGMAIVKKCSAVLSGSIKWRSNSNSGSTITLKLPISPVEEDARENPGINFGSQRIIDRSASLPPFSRN